MGHPVYILWEILVFNYVNLLHWVFSFCYEKSVIKQKMRVRVPVQFDKKYQILKYINKKNILQIYTEKG